MDIVDFFLYLSLSLIFIAFILQIFSYFLFKNNVHKYDELISEFRSRNLDLDIITNIYSFFLVLCLTLMKSFILLISIMDVK